MGVFHRLVVLQLGWLLRCWLSVCCALFFLFCGVLCAVCARPSQINEGFFQETVRRGTPLHESGMPLTTANVPGGVVHVG